MTSDEAYVPLPGSDRPPLADSFPDAQPAAEPEALAQQQIEVTVVLRSAEGAPDAALAGSTGPLSDRAYLSREELAAQFGADPADLAAVESFARRNGLSVVATTPASRTMVLSGTVSALCQAFRVDLTHYQLPTGMVRGRTGPIQVPASLLPIVQSVTGLDNRPQATPKLRRLDESGAQAPGASSYTPPQIARLYDFPTGIDGAGQCIGILEFGGGFSQSDLTGYFSNLGVPLPQVTVVSIDGGQNSPTGGPNSADGEVLLDIEVAGSIAPGAHLVVYFAPNTSQGFVDALSTAIHDSANNPTILSISWGGPESTWTSTTIQAMDAAFKDAAMLGMSVFCAAGDSGSSDGLSGGANVDFPASDPYVSGCGGTHLQASAAAITGEVVWNDPGDGATGGGVSTVFGLPAWQKGNNVPAAPSPNGGRGVPDVAGDASPRSGYQVLVDGQQSVFGGTSAVAPLWAGLTALMNQKLGKPVGFLNSLIYMLPAGDGAFHDITSGTNGAYHAGPGWDPCTGLGSPDGAKLAAALSQPAA